MMSFYCLLCLALIGVPGSYGQPRETYVIEAYFNGDFDNIAQKETGHAYIQARVVPVTLPVFGDQPAFFVEEVYDGVPLVINLGVVAEIPGNRVGLKLYDFLNYTGIKPLSYDIAQLSQLQEEDLRTDDDCYAEFEIEDNRLLSITYPECKYLIDGKHPRFVSTIIDCRTWVAVFPAGVNQEVLSEPYIVRRKGGRYPITHPSEDFVSPCED